MATPAQLAVAEVHALLDGVIALFAGRRDARTISLDPARQSTGAFWQEAIAGLGSDQDDATHFVCSIASTPELHVPLPLNEGDRILAVVASCKQTGAGAVKAELYSLAGGARTLRASAQTAGATLDYQELSLTGGGMPYTVPANTSMLLVITAGGQGDAFGGSELTFDHP